MIYKDTASCIKVDLLSGADSWKREKKKALKADFGFRIPFEWEHDSENLGKISKKEREEKEKCLIDAFSCISKT